MLTAITGINWGDEGKGRMVDLLSQDYDIVARYQGGDNAGHTVKNERGKFVLNLIPSGILRPDVVCVMGGGMVIDPEHLEKEIAALTEKGVEISPKNLKISDRATITMPFHVAQDGLEEERLSKTGAQFGSTKRGIAYSYGDKFMKKLVVFVVNIVKMNKYVNYFSFCTLVRDFFCTFACDITMAVNRNCPNIYLIDG